jgi:hypothetical protein
MKIVIYFTGFSSTKVLEAHPANCSRELQPRTATCEVCARHIPFFSSCTKVFETLHTNSSVCVSHSPFSSEKKGLHRDRYYESIKRELKTRPIYECRCDERLKTKASTIVVYYESIKGELDNCCPGNSEKKEFFFYYYNR